MRGVKGTVLQSMLDFIYCGETQLEKEDIESFMKLSETEQVVNMSTTEKNVKHT